MGQIKTRRTRGIWRSEQGFGFAQIIVILPMVLVIMGSAASYFYQKLITNIQIRARESFSIHQQNMQTDLENPLVWDEVLRMNEAMNCLQDSTCASVIKREFYVYGVDGKPLSGPGSTGYQIDGTPCLDVDDECPIKWRFEWRPMCSDAATCPYDTEIEFTGQLVEPGEVRSSLNLDRFKIILYRKIF